MGVRWHALPLSRPEFCRRLALSRSVAQLGPQTVIYFAIAGGSLALALSLLYSRYVKQDQRAVQSGGGFTFFAAFMLLFAVGAAAAGYVSWQAGR
jgi:hypothetical protein